MDNQVAQHITEIMQVFRDTEMHFTDTSNINAILNLNKPKHPEFTSVVYEAIAMCLAKKNMHSTHVDLAEWQLFHTTHRDLYNTQLLIGLGWALASNNLSMDNLSSYSFNETEISKIMDGSGYYFGLFRSRLTIKNALIPEIYEGVIPNGFDAGLGRSIYYHSKGNPASILNYLSNFQHERHPQLWSGIGTACVFVGGFTQEDLSTLLTQSGIYASNFIEGGKKACESRILANQPTPYSILFSEQFENS